MYCFKRISHACPNMHLCTAARIDSTFMSTNAPTLVHIHKIACSMKSRSSIQHNRSWCSECASSCLDIWSNYSDHVFRVELTKRRAILLVKLYFNHLSWGLEEYGLVEQLLCSIPTISSENRRQLLENTMLCGAQLHIFIILLE